jgi:outer membrane lipoprotein SlyB
MKRIEQGVLLAGLLAFMLAGCSSTDDVERANSSVSSEMDSSMPAAASATPAAPAMGATGTSASGSAPGSASIGPNSTVTSIEVVQRQAGATGAGTVAGAAVGGATGAATSGDRVYRITLRTDDGQTQVITQEWAPTFSTGDRVRISASGAIER